MAARSNKAKPKEKIKTVTKAAKASVKSVKSATVQPTTVQAAKAKSAKSSSTKPAVRPAALKEGVAPAKPAAKRTSAKTGLAKSGLKEAKLRATKAPVTPAAGNSKAEKSKKVVKGKTMPPAPVITATSKPQRKPKKGATPKISLTVAKPQVAPAVGRPQIISKPRTAAALRQLLPPPPPPPPKPELRRPAAAVAIRAFEHAVKIFNRRQFAEAKELFEQLTQRYPHEVEILSRTQMYLQVCNQKISQPQGVTSTARSVTADELYDRGVYALNIGDFSQARSCFEHALNLNPNEPHFLYSLAVTHAQIGAHAEALDYLRRSIQLQPRFRAQAFEDADLSGLRDNRKFQELLGLTSPFDLLESRR